MDHASKRPRARQLNWNAHGQHIDYRIALREDAVREGG
jgi:hypothetical protein